MIEINSYPSLLSNLFQYQQIFYFINFNKIIQPSEQKQNLETLLSYFHQETF